MDETENQAFKPLHEATSRAVSPSVRSLHPTCPEDVSARRAALLLGCYRKGEAEEPEIYAAAVASVLAAYPQEIAYRVTDPRSGIAGRSKWLPTVAEVREACEREMAPSRREAERHARAAATEAYLRPQARQADRNLVKGLYGSLMAQCEPEPEAKTPEKLATEYQSSPARLSESALKLFKRQSSRSNNPPFARTSNDQTNRTKKKTPPSRGH